MTSTRTLAEVVKEARAAAGKSQREVAAEAGIGLTVLRDIEQGRREDVLLSTARALGAVLHVSFMEPDSTTPHAVCATDGADR